MMLPAHPPPPMHLFPSPPISPSPLPSSSTASASDATDSVDEMYSSFLEEAAKVKRYIENTLPEPVITGEPAVDRHRSLNLFFKWLQNEYGRRFLRADLMLRHRHQPAVSQAVDFLMEQQLQQKSQVTIAPSPDFSSTFLQQEQHQRGSPQVLPPSSVPSGFGQLQIVPPSTPPSNNCTSFDNVATPSTAESFCCTGACCNVYSFDTPVTGFGESGDDGSGEEPATKKRAVWQEPAVVGAISGFAGFSPSPSSSNSTRGNVISSSSSGSGGSLNLGTELCTSSLAPAPTTLSVTPFILDIQTKTIVKEEELSLSSNNGSFLKPPFDNRGSSGQQSQKLFQASQLQLFRSSPTVPSTTTALNATTESLICPSTASSATPSALPASSALQFLHSPCTLPPAAPLQRFHFCCNAFFSTGLALRRHKRNCHPQYESVKGTQSGAPLPIPPPVRRHRCTWFGCGMQSNYRQSVAQHVRREHLKVPVTLVEQRRQGHLEPTSAYHFVETTNDSV